MTTLEHGPCVCVQNLTEGVPNRTPEKDETARRRRVCDLSHTVPVFSLLSWWWCVCCRCNVDSIVDRQVYITSNVVCGVGQ